jgi:hypothetical protein
VQTYEFTFKCKRCEKELTEFVTSPDVLAKEDLNQIEFEVKCSSPGCRWREKRHGAEAESIRAALKPVLSACG